VLINGRWRAVAAGTFIDRNPATGWPLIEIAAASAGDVHAAVTAIRAQLEDEGGRPWTASGRRSSLELALCQGALAGRRREPLVAPALRAQIPSRPLAELIRCEEEPTVPSSPLQRKVRMTV
jgi:hypothetical protein